MQDFLSQLLVITVLGIMLYGFYAIYIKFKDAFKNWKMVLCITILCYAIPFLSTTLIPEKSVLGSAIFAIFYVMAFLFTWITIFSYGNAKKNKYNDKIFAIDSTSNKYKTPSDFYIREIDKYIEYIDNNLFTTKVANEIKKSFMKFKTDFNKSTLYLRDDGTTNISNVRISACSMIIRVIDDMLTSGDYHIYRGTLSDEGKFLMQTWNLLMQDYIKLNPTTKEGIQINNEWVEEQRKLLLEEIQNVG